MSLLLKIGIPAFMVLVVIGLGLNGTINAAHSGYNKIESNPTVQHLQQQAVNAADNQITQVKNATINAIDAKINQVIP